MILRTSGYKYLSSVAIPLNAGKTCDPPLGTNTFLMWPYLLMQVRLVILRTSGYKYLSSVAIPLNAVKTCDPENLWVQIPFLCGHTF